jgi:hypothetical protein
MRNITFPVLRIIRPGRIPVRIEFFVAAAILAAHGTVPLCDGVVGVTTHRGFAIALSASALFSPFRQLEDNLSREQRKNDGVEQWGQGDEGRRDGSLCAANDARGVTPC